MGNVMENKKAIWKYLELSCLLPVMEEIILVKQDTREFVIEGLSCRGNEVVRVVFFSPAIIAYRKMKDQDTYKFESEEKGRSGFISVSKDSAFLNWYRSMRLLEDEEETNQFGEVKSYLFSTEMDVMEVISYGSPKVYYGPDLVVEEEKKKDEG